MKRNRKNPLSYEKNWEIIVDALGDIMQLMRVYKTGKGYLKWEYFGDLNTLNKACNRILNVVASIEVTKQQEELKRTQEDLKRSKYGPSSETGREKVPSRTSSIRNWTRSRTPEE